MTDFIYTGLSKEELVSKIALEKMKTFTYADYSKQVAHANLRKQYSGDRIAWRVLIDQPKDVYMKWLHGEVRNVEELIDLFDFLNDKLIRSTSKDMADMYREDFMESLKIDKLI